MTIREVSFKERGPFPEISLKIFGQHWAYLALATKKNFYQSIRFSSSFIKLSWQKNICFQKRYRFPNFSLSTPCDRLLQNLKFR